MRIGAGSEDRLVGGRVGRGSRLVAGSRQVAASAMWRRALVGVVSVLAMSAAWLVTAATASAFSAHGSAEQVYVTGLAPGAQMSLLKKNGETVSTQTADALGGLLFRTVAPGRLLRSAQLDGRRIRADHRPHAEGGVVESQHAQAADPKQRIHLPDDARRHPAGDRRPSADLPVVEAQRRGSDADRILGIWLRQSRRPGKRPRPGRQRAGLRSRRREHARHRLLGRRLQLLRTAAEPRCVRRDPDDRPPVLGAPPQGRHVRRLLRRHQPALRRAASPARTSRPSRRCRSSTQRRRPFTPVAS